MHYLDEGSGPPIIDELRAAELKQRYDYEEPVKGANAGRRIEIHLAKMGPTRRAR